MLNLKLLENVKSANNSSRLIKIDKIDLGFGIDTTLKKLCKVDLVSKTMVTQFKKEGQPLVTAISPVEKPLNKAQTRISCNKIIFDIIRNQILCRITY